MVYTLFIFSKKLNFIIVGEVAKILQFTECIFKRYEKKYLITSEQKQFVISYLQDKFSPDSHGKSTIMSLYLDTDNDRLVRASICAENYKEKLRLRCYGVPSEDSPSFLEIKKKYNGVVYK
ncbi:MAG: VTC domain-containing protein, partial [Oscillospiraceae bacterium]|nr:VTC domain-containing protein [Candidatus Equicaccousia limihippi]